MPKDFSRARRVGEQIQREIAEMLHSESKDPRFKLLTISAVEVANDLAYAKVFFTLLDDSLDVDNVQQALVKASGFMRKQLAKRMSLRIVPNLRFVYDKSIAYGASLSNLIDGAIETDKAKHDQDGNNGENTEYNRRGED
ncbi:Ribosome-binding factor A [hydrothermal vent metagenome]|uniref:Ribosome-binding factor A n=1 Tax=hydrothermal vent metagenome TaxID=652676 RepID=A0A3B1A7Q8_9ZZZZ